VSAAVERREFALPFAASPDKEIFAIGDIHGRADLLVDAIARIDDDLARRPIQISWPQRSWPRPSGL
jgi:hypothetical protein